MIWYLIILWSMFAIVQLTDVLSDGTAERVALINNTPYIIGAIGTLIVAMIGAFRANAAVRQGKINTAIQVETRDELKLNTQISRGSELSLQEVSRRLADLDERLTKHAGAIARLQDRKP